MTPGAFEEIREELKRISGRLDTVEERLANLEIALNGRHPGQGSAASVPSSTETPSPGASLPDSPGKPASPTPKTGALETHIGLTLLNRIGAITLVLGVGFFFKWAVDNRWIGPGGRVGIGVLAGFLAIIYGEWLARRGQRIFAQGVTAIGVSILYLAVYTGFGFYHLIAQAPAFTGLALVCALAGALAGRYHSAATAALGILGGFITPAILTGGLDYPWFLLAYLALLDVGALALARRFQWRLLEWIALAGTAVLFTRWLPRSGVPGGHLAGTLFGFVFVVLFATARFSWASLGIQLYFMAALAWLWNQPNPTPYLVYANALALTGLAIATLRKRYGFAAMTGAAYWLVYAIWAFSQARPAGALFTGITAGFLFF